MQIKKKNFLETVANLNGHEEREQYLMANARRLHFTGLKACGWYTEIKLYRESIDYYSIYVVDYFLPKLDELRMKGQLKKGKKTLPWNWAYEGELDNMNRACGKGVATKK